jgi:hypothetical protein
LGVVVLVLPAGVRITGCAAPPLDQGFDSPEPASRIYAITRAAREGDPAALAGLVQSLESDDAAVRFLAIAELKRRNGGDDLGYRAYEAPHLRAEAVERWNRWLEHTHRERSGAIDQRR